MKLILTNPVLYIENPFDFYYYSDEFTCQTSTKTDNGFELEVDQSNGERIPLLSTWSHLYRYPHEFGIQHCFVFHNNRWWEVMNSNNLDITSVTNVGWSQSYDIDWCDCKNNLSSAWHFNGHQLRSYVKLHSLFEDDSIHELSCWAKMLHSQFSFDTLAIIADWLEERGDCLFKYLREVCLFHVGVRRFKCRKELNHKCDILRHLNSYRASKLLILGTILIYENFI